MNEKTAQQRDKAYTISELKQLNQHLFIDAYFVKSGIFGDIIRLYYFSRPTTWYFRPSN